MSWLARSLVNSLKLDDDDDNNNEDTNNNSNQIESPESSTGGGVKEDLSEITRTFTRQLWGVASFLAPPSSPRDTSSSSVDPSISNSSNPESPDSESSDSGKIAGIRSDFAEIGGRFKTGISKLSNHKAVSEISKIASNFLPFGSSDEDSVGGATAVGVTDDVLVFAKNIAMHPETWLAFPLSDDEDSDDLDMSDAQQEHALAVMNLAPELAALRMELCPEHISDGYFWKIYFVLLHSRLSKHDAEVLSTPQIVEARAMLMYQPRTKLPSEDIKEGSYSQKQSANSPQEEKQSASYNAPTDTAPLETFAFEPKISMETADTESDKHPIVIRDVQNNNKTVVEEPVVQNKDEVIGSSKEGLVPVKEEAVSTSEKEVVSSKDEVINHSKEVEVSRKDEEGSNSKEVEVLSKDEVISDSKKEVVPQEDKVISSSKEVALQQTDEEDMDDWLEEDSAETTTFSNTPLGNDEDVSFSDLEEDDDETVKSTKIVGEHSNNSKNKASDDWLNVDEKNVT